MQPSVRHRARGGWLQDTAQPTTDSQAGCGGSTPAMVAQHSGPSFYCQSISRTGWPPQEGLKKSLPDAAEQLPRGKKLLSDCDTLEAFLAGAQDKPHSMTQTIKQQGAPRPQEMRTPYDYYGPNRRTHS